MKRRHDSNVLDENDKMLLDHPPSIVSLLLWAEFCSPLHDGYEGHKTVNQTRVGSRSAFTFTDQTHDVLRLAIVIEKVIMAFHNN